MTASQESFRLADWTHKDVKLLDIRMFNKLYVLMIQDDVIKTPLFINSSIFEERLNSYFMKTRYSRNDVLELTWNMHITKGYFIKIDQSGRIEKFVQDNKDKWFVSYLEISGELGAFDSIYKIKREQNDR